MTMKLPIDTSAITFSVALPPEPARDWDTKEQQADQDGQPLYAVKLVALGEGSAQILPVKFAGRPDGLVQGIPVKVVGLVATPWEMHDRFGVSFRAQSITPAIPAGAANGEAKGARAS